MLIAEDTKRLSDRVVGVLGVVDDAIGMQFTREVETIHIALCPTAGDVAPSIRLRGSCPRSELPNDFSLDFVGVQAEVRVTEGVAEIIRMAAKQWREFVVVEPLIAGVAEGGPLRLFEAG